MSTIEAEANNTQATANAVTLGTAITGQLATTTDVDYYKVTATSAGTLSVVFDVPTNSYSAAFLITMPIAVEVALRLKIALIGNHTVLHASEFLLS
jgi:hypothetical protein